jgi:hypothetical protein
MDSRSSAEERVSVILSQDEPLLNGIPESGVNLVFRYPLYEGQGSGLGAVSQTGELF